MSETTTLSPRAAAASSQITTIKKRIDEIGMTAVNELIQKIVAGLDVFEKDQISDVLCDIGPETPEQTRTSACALLRRMGYRPVALALENPQLDLNWVEGILSKATKCKDIPAWACAAIQTRLDTVQASIKRLAEKATNPQSLKKAKPAISARDRISALLDQMRQGRWVYNLIRDEVAALNGEAPTVADLMEQVEQEKVRCWEKSRGPASEQLEAVKQHLAAKALYENFDGAEEAIKSALDAKNVHGWVKAMLSYRQREIHEETRERQFGEQRTREITKIAQLSGLIDQIMEILSCATDAPVSVQQAMLAEAQAVYKEAEAIQFLLPALEGVIAGKNGTDNFVSKLLDGDTELAEKVSAAYPTKKASALRWGLLNQAKDGISCLAEVVEQRTPTPAEPTGNGKHRRPGLMASFDDSRDCRNRGHR